MQVFVQVAALGALHAGGAAVVARALADQAVRVADQPLEALQAPPGGADAAGVAVVDEDRRGAGLEVDVGGEAADVQRSHIAISSDTAIWLCSEACSTPSSTSEGSAAHVGVPDHVPERLGDEVLLGQVERDYRAPCCP